MNITTLTNCSLFVAITTAMNTSSLTLRKNKTTKEVTLMTLKQKQTKVNFTLQQKGGMIA